jgi:hypothetical protein
MLQKYVLLLQQTNPSLLGGRQSMRPQEVSDYKALIRIPEYIYSQEEREKRFGKQRSHEDLVFQFGQDYASALPWTRVVTADRVSPIAVYHGDQRTMIGSLWNPLETDLTLEETIARITWDVPALAKNYLVMARTLPETRLPAIRILVRGSRASQRGGTWDRQFAELCTTVSDRVDIDLFDDNEQDDQYVVRTRGQQVKIRRIKGRYEGTGKEYDVFIDDAYLGLKGIQNTQIDSPYWSLKIHDKSSDEFLHTREGRRFSHQRSSIPSPCPCRVCSTIASFSRDASMFQMLRDHVLEMGVRPCTLPCYSISLLRSDTLQSLHSGMVFAETEAEKRRVIEVRHLCPTVQVGDTYSPARIGDPLNVQLARIQKVLSVKDMKGYWKGTAVHFIGCDSTIIAGEQYIPWGGKMSFVSDPSVVIFVGGLENMSAVYADTIWCPVQVPSYVLTGREYSGYKEQVKRRRVHGMKVLHDVPVVEAPPDLLIPSPDWQRVDENGCRVPYRGGQCGCSIVRDVSVPCASHNLVRHVPADKPARKKIREKGIYKMAPGYFSRDGLTWNKLEGASDNYKWAIFDRAIVWKF